VRIFLILVRNALVCTYDGLQVTISNDKRVFSSCS